MKIKSFVTALVLLFTANLQAQGIDFFDGDFAAAKEAAKEQDKYIFMDAYAVWCGPCKTMSRNVFPQEKVGDFFNEHFINLKVDMEKGEGKTLRQKYNVTAYPTLFVLNHEGKVVATIRGARNADALIAWAKKSILPDKAMFDKLKAQYKKGNRTPNLLKSLIKMNAAYGTNYDALMTEFLASITEAEKIDNKNADFLFSYTKTINTPSLAVLKNYEDYFRDTKGSDNFDAKFLKIAKQSVKEAAEVSDLKAKEAALSFLKEHKIKDYKKEQDLLELAYYLETEEWTNYHKVATKVIKKYAAEQSDLYQEIAWNHYKNHTEQKHLEAAVDWAQKAIEINDNFTNNYTQASLLYKLKNYKEAKEALMYAKTLTNSRKQQQKAQHLLDLM